MNTNLNNSINFTVIKYKNNIIGGSNNKYEEPSKKGITIYIKTECPYCIKSLDLINNKYKKEEIKIIDVLKKKYITEDKYEEDKKNFLNFIKKYTGKVYETFPMIFIDGKFIGGFDYLNSMKGGGIKKYKIIKI